jgi:hypothetical protein
MAIVVLVLWAFTAGAGTYLLVTSSLGRGGTPDPEAAASATQPAATAASATKPAAAAASSTKPAAAAVTQPAAAAVTQPAAPVTQPAATQPAAAARPQASPQRQASQREMRRAARERWDPPSLTAARKAPMLPGARSVLEFAHPACALIGFAFWLGFTLIHARGLAWIAFGLIAFTACLGLAWFTANVRAARTGDRDRPTPYFSGRLMVVHGCAAAVTITLAALTALVIRG